MSAEFLVVIFKESNFVDFVSPWPYLILHLSFCIRLLLDLSRLSFVVWFIWLKRSSCALKCVHSASCRLTLSFSLLLVFCGFCSTVGRFFGFLLNYCVFLASAFCCRRLFCCFFGYRFVWSGPFCLCFLILFNIPRGWRRFPAFAFLGLFRLFLRYISLSFAFVFRCLPLAFIWPVSFSFLLRFFRFFGFVYCFRLVFCLVLSAPWLGY